jgi:2-polyprenyl-6-methoxyphenol hydroxylase-like FAD-dependent oxidoreductase
MIETSVLIAGGGPVGLTLAMDLAWRGIDVIVVELRRAGEPPNVKCNQISARSMEILRRIGVATTSSLTPDLAFSDQADWAAASLIFLTSKSRP